MSKNLRLEALTLAVQYHQSEQMTFASTIVETAKTFQEFLEGSDEPFIYWRMDGADIWYRARKTPSAPLERWHSSGRYNTESGRWSTNYDRSNPQSVADIRRRRESYREVSPENVPAALRATS